MKATALGIFVFMVLFGSAPLLAQDHQLAGVELQAMADTFQYALENNPTNETSDWVNPDTARSGAVVPTRTYENAQGQPCREFITTIIIADREEQGYGTACRQPDGSWRLVSDTSQSGTVATETTAQTYIAQSPAVYYAYPSGFFGPSHIYLSFGHVYRSGRVYWGRHYMDGRRFRSRNSFRVRQRVNLGPQIFFRYRLHDELNYRDWDRRQRHEGKYGSRGYRQEKHSGKGHGKSGRGHR